MEKIEIIILRKLVQRFWKKHFNMKTQREAGYIFSGMDDLLEMYISDKWRRPEIIVKMKKTEKIINSAIKLIDERHPKHFDEAGGICVMCAIRDILSKK